MKALKKIAQKVNAFLSSKNISFSILVYKGEISNGKKKQFLKETQYKEIKINNEKTISTITQKRSKTKPYACKIIIFRTRKNYYFIEVIRLLSINYYLINLSIN